VTALLALALAAAPGCPGALAEAEALAGDPAPAERALSLVDKLEAVGAGGPVAAVRREAEALGDPGAPREAAPVALARLRRTLARHCALAEAAPAKGASAADRAALAEVLARPEYARRTADPEALRRTILRLWQDLLELLGTSEAERYASTGRAIFLAAAAAALALLLVAARRRRGAATARGASAPDASPGSPARRSTAEDAAEALARGDAREAVRRAFLAVLASLERAGRVRGGSTLTNGEILAAVAVGGPAASATSTSTPAPAAALATDVATLARLFDRAIYGGLPVAAQDARSAVERAREVTAALAVR
jgi:hypothetical protein